MDGWYAVVFEVNPSRDLDIMEFLDLLFQKAGEIDTPVKHKVKAKLDAKYGTHPTSTRATRLIPIPKMQMLEGCWLAYEVCCKDKREAMHLKLVWADYLFEND